MKKILILIFQKILIISIFWILIFWGRNIDFNIDFDIDFNIDFDIDFNIDFLLGCFICFG